jgi:hypothetical protein
MLNAVAFAEAALAPRREERRVVIWLVDGGPQEAEKVWAMIRRPGNPIEHVGIGIQVSPGPFKHGARVDDLRDLPKAFQAVLLGSEARRGR